MTNRLTREEIRIIVRRCTAASPGPWRAFVEGRDHDAGADFIRTGAEDIELIGASTEDCDFIAAARADVARLVEEVESLQQELEILRSRSP